jgi:hypothetical protein
MVASAFTLTACAGFKNPFAANSTAVKGADGQSAYDVWISLGNSGTKEDFMTALKGATGNTGSDGTIIHTTKTQIAISHLSELPGAKIGDLYLMGASNGASKFLGVGHNSGYLCKIISETEAVVVGNLTGPRGYAGANGKDGKDGKDLTNRIKWYTFTDINNTDPVVRFKDIFNDLGLVESFPNFTGSVKMTAYSIDENGAVKVNNQNAYARVINSTGDNVINEYGQVAAKINFEFFRGRAVQSYLYNRLEDFTVSTYNFYPNAVIDCLYLGYDKGPVTVCFQAIPLDGV